MGLLRHFAVAAALVSGVLSSPAHAREMQGRFGLGYNGQFANSTGAFVNTGVPGISMKYGLTRSLAAEVIGGVATSLPANMVGALKLFVNIFFENNLNFYFMGGGGVLAGGGTAGAQFLTGFGAEFFIPGIDSLGFAFETGASIDNLTGGTFIVKTMGFSFLNAGIHFYF